MFKVGDRVKVKNGNYEFIITKIGKNIVGKKLYLEKENSLIGFIEKELELAPFKFEDLQDGHILTYEDGTRSIFFNKLIEDGLWNVCYDDRFEVSCPKFSKDGSSCDGFTFKKIMKIEQAFTGIVEWERGK